VGGGRIVGVVRSLVVVACGRWLASGCRGRWGVHRLWREMVSVAADVGVCGGCGWFWSARRWRGVGEGLGSVGVVVVRRGVCWRFFFQDEKDNVSIIMY